MRHRINEAFDLGGGAVHVEKEIRHDYYDYRRWGNIFSPFFAVSYKTWGDLFDDLDAVEVEDAEGAAIYAYEEGVLQGNLLADVETPYRRKYPTDHTGLYWSWHPREDDRGLPPQPFRDKFHDDGEIFDFNQDLGERASDAQHIRSWRRILGDTETVTVDVLDWNTTLFYRGTQLLGRQVNGDGGHMWKPSEAYKRQEAGGVNWQKEGF